MANANRNSSIELLRILAAAGVVILHYNSLDAGGAFAAAKGAGLYSLIFLESLFICAVNLFIMISGYFLSANEIRKPSKVIMLFLQVILFNAAFYALGLFTGARSFSFTEFIYALLPRNYFAVLYCTLYIFSKYINIILDKLDKKGFKKLLILMFCVFSVLTAVLDETGLLFNIDMTGLSPVALLGSGEGYTIVNFVLMYVIGAYIRRYGAEIKTGTAALAAAGSLAAVFLRAAAGMYFTGNFGAAFNYNNPFVIVFAAFVLTLASKANFGCKAINELSGAAFTCFLFHTALIPYFKIEWAAEHNAAILVIHALLCSLAAYLISYVVYKIYSFIISPVNKLVKKMD